jgi:hypothetical protein
MKENIQGGDNGKPENHSRCGRGRIRDRNGRQRRRAGGKALSLRLRSAEDDRLRNPRRYLQRQAEGAEQGHHADRAISGRAARAGAAGSAAGESRRRGVLHFVIGQCRDAVAAGRRDVDALPVPLRSASRQGDRRPRGVQGGQGDDRGDRAGRPCHRAGDARASQHVFQARDQERR